MLNPANKELVRKFNLLVNTAVDNDIKKVVYLAIAEALLKGTTYDRQLVVNKSFITSLVDQVGELAVIDKNMLTQIINNVARAKLSLVEKEICVCDTNNYLEFLGIHFYLSPSELETLNAHYNLFKDVYNIVYLLSNSAKPVDTSVTISEEV